MHGEPHPANTNDERRLRPKSDGVPDDSVSNRGLVARDLGQPRLHGHRIFRPDQGLEGRADRIHVQKRNAAGEPQRPDCQVSLAAATPAGSARTAGKRGPYCWRKASIWVRKPVIPSAGGLWEQLSWTAN